MHARMITLVVFSAGCASPAPAPPVSPAPPPGDAAGPEPGVGARGIDAPNFDAATPAIASVAPPADAAAPAALDPSCVGAELDLRVLLHANSCRSAAAKEPSLPAGVVVQIEPMRARAGHDAGSAILLVNTTTSALDLHLLSMCGVDDQVTTVVLDKRGKRADLLHGCSGGGGCGSSIRHLRLMPGGRARFAFRVGTIVRRHDSSCIEEVVGPMKIGAYVVEVDALFLPGKHRGRLVVTR